MTSAVTSAEIKIESDVDGNLATTTLTSGSFISAFYRGKLAADQLITISATDNTPAVVITNTIPIGNLQLAYRLYKGTDYPSITALDISCM